MLVTLYIAAAATWLILTVFWQFEHYREKSAVLRAVNSFHLLPIWTFFAPRPGMSDTHVLYRDRTADGTMTDWSEIDLVEERKALHWLWNPRKRLDKVAVDALSDVKTVKNRGEEAEVDDDVLQQQVKLSKGYLVLLNIAVSRPKLDPAAEWRQFAVVDASLAAGERSISPVFVSPFHRFSA